MRRIIATSAALVLMTLAARGAAAQERIFVRQEPGTPVVAVQVLVGVGPADEPAEQAGISYLAARAVVDPARTVLDSLGAHLDVEQQSDAIAFSLTAAPDAWAEASRVLLVALFRDPVDSAAVSRQRAAIVRELQGRASSPADALAREVEKAVYGADHPWGRPAVGTAETVAKLRFRDVDPYLRGFFTPERSVVTVVGPVEQDSVLDVLSPHLAEGPLKLTPVDAPQPADSVARQDYNSITTWVSAVWRFGPDTDVEAVRMLSHLALERVSFGPSRRSVYNARSEVVRYAGGGELRLHLVVPPREADAWAERLREAVGFFAAQPLAAGVFQERLRRYRGERLLELESPEARAAAMARAALLGDPSATLADFLGLSPARLQAAATALHPAVVVYLGPSVDQGT